MRRLLVFLALAFSLAASRAGAGDTIVLNNGRVIQADRAWFEGNQLFYERAGAVFGLPRSLVKSTSGKIARTENRQRYLQTVDAG